MNTAITRARRALYAIAFAVTGLAGPNAMAAGYPNPQLLTSAAELAIMLDRKDVRVIDVRSRAAYDSGHIPGALHLGADDVIDPKAPVDGVLRPQAELAGIIGRRGIDKNVHVVLYDDKGGFHAARLFWMFEYFGHRTFRFATRRVGRRAPEWVTAELVPRVEEITTMECQFFYAFPTSVRLILSSQKLPKSIWEGCGKWLWWFSKHGGDHE